MDMSSKSLRIMLVGTPANTCTLESSYKSALDSLGHEVLGFDMPLAIRRSCRFGRVGREFNRYLPVDAWTKKANRSMVTTAIDFAPDMVIICGSSLVYPGALAQVRASIGSYLVLLWPDTLLNLGIHSIACLPLYDLVATYSKSTVEGLRTMGARSIKWVPLGGDPLLHSPAPLTGSESAKYRADVSFIGGWRPEREKVLSEFKGLDL